MNKKNIMTYAQIALAGRTLGMLLYYPPLSTTNASLLEVLTSSAWEHEWPPIAGLENAAALIRQGLGAPWRNTLEATYQRLFIGPHALPAPPWGSVYLDPEGVLFGESTLALRRWLEEANIAVDKREGEPEDHIGLLLLLAAWLADNNPSLLNDLVGQHVLTWSGRYLTLLEQGAGHPFYQGMAQLTRLTLEHWQGL